mmetsp:Transcript_27443/g.76716  ORF Transcript_27443/g.76716 Transcript_27443/m.76716 type:complete len:494 (+) Transcript_27443:103-1584(+)|eukprot:CAMPEP_0119121866 /NCGR_PEP_ID=MMETSP1310-20130426/2293_1 /TAXON_ID=464262 /ORGANISM="Genus nov. species nov., Strain RCC2339" /LENGTH=493 /DNA_ID=CAMNT_0007111447 /DNA_START=103 /DNA_END=1584 /DNA_ORIENTATION=+
MAANEGDGKNELQTKLKEEANELYKEHKIQEAIDKYSEAIEVGGDNAIIFSNRALCWLRLDMNGAAMEDAVKAIKTDPQYAKGYYRRGSARYGLGKYKLALQDFTTTCKLMPKSKAARERMKECKKTVDRVNFERAIEMEEPKPPSECVELDNIPLESDFKGTEMPWPLTEEYVRQLMQDFKDQKSMRRRHMYQLLLGVLEILKAEKAFNHITMPDEAPDGTDTTKPLSEPHVVVWGDLHGQYYDMLHIFESVGLPGKGRRMLFNGDYVDRGSFSCEVILTLFALKTLYPKYVHLNRGNHETTNMNRVYGFAGEVKAKYGGNAYDLFREIFNYLPLGHIIENKVFVVHGGLPREDGVKLQELEQIDRVREPGDPSYMADVLWSDPSPLTGRQMSKRGIGMSFGPDVTTRFLAENNLELVIRSHEVKPEGYEVAHSGKCITVFSAPNYCDEMGNKSAVVRLKKDCKPEFLQFTHVPHPNIRPMAYTSGGGMFGF